MKSDIGFFCKSFSEDFHRLKKLIDSFEIFMIGRSIDISIPRKDERAFFDIIGHRICVNLFFDEDYIDIESARLDGWRQQQVAKLCSYRVATSKRYLALDSDMQFYRQLNDHDLPFFDKHTLTASTLWTVAGDFENQNLETFIKNHGTTVLDYPSKSNFVFSLDKNNYKTWLAKSKTMSTSEQSQIINQIFGEKKWFFYQPGQILTKDVLLGFHNYLKSLELCFTEIIELSPWEYNWYGEWFVSQYGDTASYLRSCVLHFQTSSAIKRYIEQHGAANLIEKFPIINYAARHYDADDIFSI